MKFPKSFCFSANLSDKSKAIKKLMFDFAKPNILEIRYT